MSTTLVQDPLSGRDAVWRAKTASDVQMDPGERHDDQEIQHSVAPILLAPAYTMPADFSRAWLAHAAKTAVATVTWTHLLQLGPNQLHKTPRDRAQF